MTRVTISKHSYPVAENVNTSAGLLDVFSHFLHRSPNRNVMKRITWVLSMGILSFPQDVHCYAPTPLYVFWRIVSHGLG